MGITIETTIAIPKPLFDQAERVAQQLKLSPHQLCELAVAQFLLHYQSQALAENDQDDEVPPTLYQAESSPQTVTPTTSTARAISQGDLYWLQVAAPGATEAGYPHPHIVLQADLLNRSRLDTVVVCGLTSNLKRATEPGNILLEVGEANLTRPSVIIVSQLSTVNKTALGAYIGTLSPQRIEQIWAGLRFQQRAFFAR